LKQYIPQFYQRPWLGRDHKLEEFGREPYSGQIKRQMYRPGKLDLRWARIVGATWYRRDCVDPKLDVDVAKQLKFARADTQPVPQPSWPFRIVPSNSP